MINRIKEALRRRRNMNRTIAELHSLDDNCLRDIGIDRTQIETVARGIIDFHRVVRDGNEDNSET